MLTPLCQQQAQEVNPIANLLLCFSCHHLWQTISCTWSCWHVYGKQDTICPSKAPTINSWCKSISKRQRISKKLCLPRPRGCCRTMSCHGRPSCSIFGGTQLAWKFAYSLTTTRMRRASRQPIVSSKTTPDGSIPKSSYPGATNGLCSGRSCTGADVWRTMPARRRLGLTTASATSHASINQKSTTFKTYWTRLSGMPRTVTMPIWCLSYTKWCKPMPPQDGEWRYVRFVCYWAFVVVGWCHCFRSGWLVQRYFA